MTSDDLWWQVDFTSYIEMQTWPGAFAINIPFVRARILCTRARMHAREMIASFIRRARMHARDMIATFIRRDHTISAPLPRYSRLHAPSVCHLIAI